ncbi:MAG TPA: hypothetical protein VHQ93_03180 [Chitinophagaceae bacterium]|jgi:hypothetical protein|nr:hypothetical protein [Chitinophagaceae bacterium]
MKKNLLPGFTAIFILFLFSCSNKYYTASNFEEKTEKHKVVAILPAEVTLSGKLPKNLKPEDIAKAEERESIDFQYALMNSILNHANTKKYITTVNFQDINTTQKILEQNNISVRDSWKKNDEELAKLLGVDAVIRMNIRKQRYMSDEASYGVGMAKQVIYRTGLGSKVPVPSSVGKTYDIYATCNLLSENQTLWNDNYKRSTDYDTAPNVIVEWITDDFGENFPYKQKRKKR